MHASPLTPELRNKRATKAALKRHRAPDDPELLAADQEFRTARLAQHIDEVVNAAPPLTGDQVERLRALLPSVADEAVA
jgi:hypothetical protein